MKLINNKYEKILRAKDGRKIEEIKKTIDFFECVYYNNFVVKVLKRGLSQLFKKVKIKFKKMLTCVKKCCTI